MLEITPSQNFDITLNESPHNTSTQSNHIVPVAIEALDNTKQRVRDDSTIDNDQNMSPFVTTQVPIEPQSTRLKRGRPKKGTVL